MAARSCEMIAGLLASTEAVQFKDLQAVLGNASRATTFRYLKQVPYQRSYNHNGRYYSRNDPERYDRFGLLSCGDIHSSRDRTLTEIIIVAIVERTDNVPEHFFGSEKQHLRRRLGRANLGRDLEDQPAQAALAANLRHPDYVRVLCGSLDHLPMAFAELNEQALAQTTPLSRSNRDSKLQQRIRTLLKGEKTADSGADG